MKVAILEYEKEAMEAVFTLAKILEDVDWTFRLFTKASDLARKMKKEEYRLFLFDEVFKTPRLESVFVHDNPNALFVYLCDNALMKKGNDQRNRILYINKSNIKEEILNQKDIIASLCHQQEFYELNYDGVHMRLPYQDIYYVDKMEKMLYFHTKKGEFHERASMSKLSETLESYGFLRVHVSFLVNAIHIVAWYKDEVELSTGERVPLSRSQKKRIFQKKKPKETE